MLAGASTAGLTAEIDGTRRLAAEVSQQIGEFLDITLEDDGDDTFIVVEDNSISK